MTWTWATLIIFLSIWWGLVLSYCVDRVASSRDAPIKLEDALYAIRQVHRENVHDLERARRTFRSDQPEWPPPPAEHD